MREIKLKAWDVIAKKWITKFWLTSNGDLIYPNGGRPIIELKKDCYKLVQYTGLKDKNGKEVYEGDIIRSYNEFGEAFATLSIVKYDESYAKYRGFDIECGDYEEVIGNIYENPELLEVTQ